MKDCKNYNDVWQYILPVALDIVVNLMLGL